jgi:hypothetical protein
LNSNAATLDGLEQTKSNATLDILAEHSYEARRIRLNDDFSAMQSAIDLRILTLLKADADDGRFFFSLALFTLIVLAPTTIWLGIFLNDHEARVHHSHKSQVRRLNDDLTRLRSELPHHQPDHPAPTPGENPADL